MTTVWRRSWKGKPGRPAPSRSDRQAPSHFFTGLVGVVVLVLTDAPQIMARLRVPEFVRALKHPRDGVARAPGPLAQMAAPPVVRRRGAL